MVRRLCLQAALAAEVATGGVDSLEEINAKLRTMW